MAIDVNAVVLCENCEFLRQCRAVCVCNHPHGLKTPQPEQGTFCCYGVNKNK